MAIKTGVQVSKEMQCKYCQGKGWLPADNVTGFVVCGACSGTGLSDYPEHLDPYYNCSDEDDEE